MVFSGLEFSDLHLFAPLPSALGRPSESQLQIVLHTH